jgi:RNA polymerase sigma-70 factor (ECF subfamily)
MGEEMSVAGFEHLGEDRRRSSPGGRFARRPVGALKESQLLAQAIARAKEGEPGALHFLYVRFADDVCAYIRSIAHDHHEAEDITQTLFLKLPTKIQRYEQREAPFAAWIIRVARNAALDHVRARRAIPFEEVHTTDDGREDEDSERCRSLRDALGQLPLEQRQVLVLRHIAGLTPCEIAERLGKTESAVHGLHHRGRRALCTALGELEAAPVTMSA